MRGYLARPALLSLLFAVVPSHPALGTTIWVPQHQPTIQAAVDVAGAGDSVFVSCATYHESVTLKSGVHVQASLSLCVDLQPFSGDAFVCNGVTGASVEGFRILGVSQIPGSGAVGVRSTDSNVAIRGCEFRLWERAAVIVTGGAPSVSNCDFWYNGSTSNDGGAIYSIDASPTVSACGFFINSAANGGAIWCGGTSAAMIIGCRFVNCTASGFGGSIYCEDATTVTGCILGYDYWSTGGSAPNGGGIACVGDVVISGCTMRSCGRNQTADRGGSIHVLGGAPTIDGCYFTDSYANVLGGAVYVGAGQATITNCTMDRSFSIGGGGGVAVENASVAMDGVVGAALGAGDGGSSLHLINASANVVRCTFTEGNGGVTPLCSGLFAANSTLSVQQSILRNTCDGLPDVLLTQGTIADFSCCNVDSARATSTSSTLNWLAGNFKSTPAFCAPAGCGGVNFGDYSVAANSECLPANNSCGLQVGALGQGCAATPVTSDSWGKIKSRYR
jgi:hypothetical protein